MNLQESISAFEAAVSSGLEQILEAALSDDLTPLRNLIALHKVASQVGAGGDNPDIVVFGDINHFHTFNERYGHDVGDAAITRVGELIQKTFVQECGAKAFRRSGDEFIILLSSPRLGDFRARVPQFASCSFSIEGEIRETAVSFGCAISKGEVGFADLLARAEVACQAAKFEGDGTLVEWSDELEAEGTQVIRGRCTVCKASITCYAPKEAIPKSQAIEFCPCCGQFLGH